MDQSFGNTYEKPMSANVTMQDASAMNENTKYQILANEVIRRMLNTGESVGEELRRDIIDDFGRKILTSGFSLEKTRRVLLRGLRGYMRTRFLDANQLDSPFTELQR